MGHRTYVAAAKKLGKHRNYEAALRQWASKYQWRARCQAFDAAQLEREREEAEQTRLQVFATSFMIGNFFLTHVADDLKLSWLGEWVNPDTGLKEKYTPNEAFSVTQKLKLLARGYEMAVRNASARKQVLLDQGTKTVEKTAFDEAFDEIIETDPDLHDAYVRLISEALKRSHSIRDKKPRGSC